MKKEIKVLLLIFIIALLMRMSFVFITPIKYWDESVYSNLGYQLNHNFFDYSLKNSDWSDFIPSAGNLNYAWPKIGFRAPLLPYVLSIFYLLKLDFLIDFLMPLIGSLSVILIYFIGKKLFNEKIGIYSAFLFCFIPLHVIFSSKILTDVLFVFFILISILFYWKGFEENINKYKLLFGLFFGLSILCRYNGLWFIPIFGIYLVIRNKEIKFFKDKFFWYSLLIFLLTILPIFIYSFFTYGNFLGAFIHGNIASSYWGGLQNINFFFQNGYNMFSIIGFVFLIALIYILYKKEFIKKEVYFLILFFGLFFILASIMPHKEDRLLLPIVPVICLISGWFLSNIRKYNKVFLLIIILICSYSLYLDFNNTYEINNNINSKCFLKTLDFLKTQNSYIILSENSPIFYYYLKQESRYYPYPINEENIKKTSNSSKKFYFVFTKLNSGMKIEELNNLRNILSENYKLVFNCSIDPEFNFIYSERE